ncbi:MAG: DmsE family decaheme c-type cytochrome [Thermoanaerobaculia bacterium]
MRNRIRPFLLALAVTGFAVLGFATAATAADDDCAGCHDEVVASFGKTVHGRAFKSDAAHATANCASCHIGAQEHAASGGEQKPQSLHKGAGADKACLSCHGGKPNQAHWEGSAHEMAGVACAECHNPHDTKAAATKAAAGRATGGPGAITEKCLSCHGGQRVAMHQRSSHPMRDGQMECSSCHNPHGTSGEKLIRAGSVNELCYTCHQNLRGPFLWEHSPVREDCLTCHRAHGSNYPQMLQARVAQLCQSCHQQGRHQTVPGVPNSVWNSNKACANCHSQVHGSNHPSGPLFQR